MPIELPLADAPPPERADAARNREVILAAASRLVDELGVERVSMDAVAREAGVGKGTLFRRFTSREGLMAAVLDRSETAWQASILSGPPPLGPGAPPYDRLLAMGHSRLRLNVTHGALIKAATGPSGGGPDRMLACHAVSERSRTAAISPSRLVNRRKRVPLPTPASRATASIETRSTPSSSTSRDAAARIVSRLRAASARSGGGASARGSSMGTGSP